MDRGRTSPRCILQQRHVHRTTRQVNIAHNRSANEDVFDSAQVGILDLLVNRDVVQLDVEVLIDALEGAGDLDIVLELDGDRLVNQGFEEAFPNE